MGDYRQDLYSLLSNVSSDDLVENINKVSMLLGDPKQSAKVEKVLRTFLQEERDDPAVKLLVALTPFLSKTRQAKINEYIKVINTSNLFHMIQQMQQEQIVLQQDTEDE
ncbi:MAG TPA: hypothetical protein DCE00_04900 [Firmicutes bacterium]|jgi:hypothetical protein|nr:hypothetical protein [Bacillota bacterium]